MRNESAIHKDDRRPLVARQSGGRGELDRSVVAPRITPIATANKRIASSAATSDETTIGKSAATLATELEAARWRIAGLERRLIRGEERASALREQLRSDAEAAQVAERQSIELEHKLESTRRSYDRQLAGAQNKIDELANNRERIRQDNAGLAHALRKKDQALEDALARASYLEAALAAAERECQRRHDDLGRVTEKHRKDSGALQDRLDAMTGRALSAEKLLADVQNYLVNRADHAKPADIPHARRSLAHENVQLRAELQSSRDGYAELERSRMALDRATKTLLLAVRGQVNSSSGLSPDVGEDNGAVRTVTSHERIVSDLPALARLLSDLIEAKQRNEQFGALPANDLAFEARQSSAG